MSDFSVRPLEGAGRGPSKTNQLTRARLARVIKHAKIIVGVKDLNNSRNRSGNGNAYGTFLADLENFRPQSDYAKYAAFIRGDFVIDNLSDPYPYSNNRSLYSGPDPDNPKIWYNDSDSRFYLKPGTYEIEMDMWVVKGMAVHFQFGQEGTGWSKSFYHGNFGLDNAMDTRARFFIDLADNGGEDYTMKVLNWSDGIGPWNIPGETDHGENEVDRFLVITEIPSATLVGGQPV